MKGGKKPRAKKADATATPAPVVAPVVEAVVADATVAPKARVSKPRAKKAESTAVPSTGAVADAPKKAAKQPRKPKAVAVVADASTGAVVASTDPAKEDEAGDEDSRVRSFKVQLPGNEQFIGRFTGLTPYQAANKALSKYFRDKKTAGGVFTLTEITFSIRESTRNSKRSTYVYNGRREKLLNPVKYTIKGLDGVAREIVKEYKNKLVKVKKTEESTSTPVATPAQAPATTA
jgi:hypothetical protein